MKQVLTRLDPGEVIEGGKEAMAARLRVETAAAAASVDPRGLRVVLRGAVWRLVDERRAIVAVGELVGRRVVADAA